MKFFQLFENLLYGPIQVAQKRGLKWACPKKARPKRARFFNGSEKSAFLKTYFFRFYDNRESRHFYYEGHGVKWCPLIFLLVWMLCRQNKVLQTCPCRAVNGSIFSEPKPNRTLSEGEPNRRTACYFRDIFWTASNRKKLFLQLKFYIFTNFFKNYINVIKFFEKFQCTTSKID